MHRTITANLPNNDCNWSAWHSLCLLPVHSGSLLGVQLGAVGSDDELGEELALLAIVEGDGTDFAERLVEDGHLTLLVNPEWTHEGTMLASVFDGIDDSACGLFS